MRPLSSEEIRVRVRITLNNRLATAAAAIVKRITSRSRPRVFRAVSPFKKGSIEAGGIVNDVYEGPEEELGVGRGCSEDRSLDFEPQK